MSQIILKGITTPFNLQHFFTRDDDQNKSTSILQLYYPPRIPFLQNTCQQLLLTCEYCEDFKNSFFIAYLQWLLL